MFDANKKRTKGPLKEFYNQMTDFRREAIYNTSYRYIKEIIYNDEFEKEFGSDREGYEKYKNTDTYGTERGTTDVQYSGETSIRAVTHRPTGEILGYIQETKNQINEPLNEMFKIYENAKKEFMKILDVQDIQSVEYYLDDKIYIARSEANNLRSAIDDLQGIIKDYNEDPDFRLFFDKIRKL